MSNNKLTTDRFEVVKLSHCMKRDEAAGVVHGLELYRTTDTLSGAKSWDMNRVTIATQDCPAGCNVEDALSKGVIHSEEFLDETEALERYMDVLTEIVNDDC